MVLVGGEWLVAKPTQTVNSRQKRTALSKLTLGGCRLSGARRRPFALALLNSEREKCEETEKRSIETDCRFFSDSSFFSMCYHSPRHLQRKQSHVDWLYDAYAKLNTSMNSN